MKRELWIAGFHVVLGVLIANAEALSFYYGLLVLLIGTSHIIVSGNRNNEAAIWAGYLVGLEILMRMTGGFLVYEAGKYSVIVLLLTGLLAERGSKAKPWPIMLYALMLLPSFAVVEFPDFLHFRKDVSFNLSGPLTLVVSTIYFYQRSHTMESLLSILHSIVFPLISVLVYLTLVTPELSDIEYGTQSNFAASAGFGPNQVSIAMGLGILIVGLSLFVGKRATGSIVSDILLMFLLLVRGLATFSRGGMIGGVLALAVLMILSFVLSRKVIPWPKTVLYAIVAVSVIVYSWNYVNSISDNRLQYRYQGINYRTGQAKEITSGRLFILQNELAFFVENPIFGIGPGMIREITLRRNFIANTHSEYSRTLAEHGLFGLVALIILFFFPFQVIKARPRELYPILYSILFLVFFTMFHSAMRLAMPGFLYGVVFLYPGFAHGIRLTPQ